MGRMADQYDLTTSEEAVRRGVSYIPASPYPLVWVARPHKPAAGQEQLRVWLLLYIGMLMVLALL